MGQSLSLNEFVAQVPKYLARAVTIVIEEVQAEVAVQALLGVQDLSPVGSAVKGDKHPGKYRASHVASVGTPMVKVLDDLPAYALIGEAEVRGVVAKAGPQEPVFISNTSLAKAGKDGERYPYGHRALEPGRRQYSRVASRKAQWIGSVQAPEGIYGPTVAALKARKTQIRANAIANARRRLRGDR